MCTAAAKMARKIGKIEDATQELKQGVYAQFPKSKDFLWFSTTEVLQRRREMEEEMRSEFVEATGQDRDPDPT